MKIMSIILAYLFFAMLARSVIAITVTNNDTVVSFETKNKTAIFNGDWYCDHWPETCVETCETAGSPWGTYTSCRLSPPWDPGTVSNNPYDDLGKFHNKTLDRLGALGGVGRKISPNDLGKKLSTTHMIQLSAEYLCEQGLPENQIDMSKKSIETTLEEFIKPDALCSYRYAGLVTDVFNDLRDVIYSDVQSDKLVSGYLEAFKAKGRLSDKQVLAIENLYKLLPTEENIDDLPYLFDRINEFNKNVLREMSPEESVIVLLGSSIMSSSLEYWLQQLDGPSSWFEVEVGDTEPQQLRKGWFRKVLKLVAADAGGCLGGSLILGVPGCVIGGIGASAGAGAALD